MEHQQQQSTSALPPGAADAPPTPDTVPTPVRPQAFRRPHHKSRLGCVQCKQRKIKCDENKPSCDKCNRYNTTCSFRTLQPSRPSDQQRTSPNTTLGSQSTHNSSRTSPYPPAAFNSVNAGYAGEVFTMEDLEFLHHYTTNTWHTISSLPFWQSHVPQIATSYPFLMHGILALSSRHLAYTTPSRAQHLIHLSSQHHQKALTGYSQELANITKSNCHACAAFSLLLNVYAWGGGNTLFLSEPSPGSSPAVLGPDAEVELIAVLRGGNAVMAQARHWVVEGPLAPLYKPWFGFNKDPEGFTRLPSVQSLLCRSEDGDRLQHPILPHEDDARLEQLGRLWAPHPGPPAHASYPSPHPSAPSPTSPGSPTHFPPPLSPATRSVLDHTLHMLRRVFVVVTTNQIIEPQAATLSWPIIIPDAYIALVAARNPQALCLLAHYTVLLKRNGERWWIRGKAEELLGKIVGELEGRGEGWSEWIRWPVGEVGLLGDGGKSGEGSPYAMLSQENERGQSRVGTPLGYAPVHGQVQGQENTPMGGMGMEERLLDPRMNEARMK